MNTTIGYNIDLDDRPLAVTVYHRLEPSCAATAADVIERMTSLVESGIIERLDRTPVPARQRTDTPGGEVVGELKACADGLGVSLEPALQTSRRRNEFTEMQEEVSVMPVVTLVVRDARDDSVLALAPVRTGDSVVLVSDLIESIEASISDRDS